MAVHINNPISNLKEIKEKTKIHHVPCTIKCDDEAKVSTYFEPNIVKQDFGMIASFRGYPLMGQEISIPEGFNGYVLYEANEKLNEEVERTIYVSDSFQKLSYWNFDKPPCANDGIYNALSWIKLSSAIHSPVDDTDL